jgi:hypothetical protein
MAPQMTFGQVETGDASRVRHENRPSGSGFMTCADVPYMGI